MQRMSGREEESLAVAFAKTLEEGPTTDTALQQLVRVVKAYELVRSLMDALDLDKLGAVQYALTFYRKSFEGPDLELDYLVGVFTTALDEAVLRG